MGGSFRDFFLGMLASVKCLVCIVIGIAQIKDIIEGDTSNVLKTSVIAVAVLAGIGFTNLAVMFGWLVESDGTIMRKRRKIAWFLEIPSLGLIYAMLESITSQDDFKRGHGQEGMLVIFFFLFVSFFLAQVHIIPYSREKQLP